MRIGKVVGSVVATQKDEGLAELKLLVVQVFSHEHEPLDDYVVAVDAVQAGPEDVVLYATGSSARQTTLTRDKPCDAVVMAVIDSWDVEGRVMYRKQPMYLARVIGRVVATRGYEGLTGVPFQWIQPLDEEGRDAGAPLVACTVVSSGPGDLVHFVDGREAALACPVPFVPVDATILGVVEQLALDERSPRAGPGG